MAKPSRELALQVEALLAEHAYTELSPADCFNLAINVGDDSLASALEPSSSRSASELKTSADKAMGQFEQIIRSLPMQSNGTCSAEASGLSALVTALAARREMAAQGRASVEAARPSEDASLGASLNSAKCDIAACIDQSACVVAGMLRTSQNQSESAGRASAGMTH